MILAFMAMTFVGTSWWTFSCLRMPDSNGPACLGAAAVVDGLTVVAAFLALWHPER